MIYYKIMWKYKNYFALILALIQDTDIEQQAPKRCRLRIGSSSLLIVSKTLIQAFTMTFLAEWGDRSQLATIILSAREV